MAIDLNPYTEGDDHLKRVLAGLMIEDILDLNQSFHHARIENKPDLYERSCHKVKTTLHMINNAKLQAFSDILKQGSNDMTLIRQFDAACFQVIKNLQNYLEIKHL